MQLYRAPIDDGDDAGEWFGSLADWCGEQVEESADNGCSQSCPDVCATGPAIYPDGVNGARAVSDRHESLEIHKGCKSDSRCWLGEEASMDGSASFDGFADAAVGGD